MTGTLKKKPKPKTIKLKVATKGIPQRKLQLVKTPKSNLPRHPMPFAAKNMYYDERWIEKQEEGIIQKLNKKRPPVINFRCTNIFAQLLVIKLKFVMN